MTLLLNLSATGCTLWLAWHFRENERSFLECDHVATDPKLGPRLLRADVIAAGLTLLVLGGVWL